MVLSNILSTKSQPNSNIFPFFFFCTNEEKHNLKLLIHNFKISNKEAWNIINQKSGMDDQCNEM